MSHVLSTQRNQKEINYHSQLIAVLDVVWIRLVQSPTFFVIMTNLLVPKIGTLYRDTQLECKKGWEVGSAINENVPRNNQLTSPFIQKIVTKCTHNKGNISNS